ncbi:glycerate kinase, partial [Verrucomicrobiota bacterium]
RQRLRGSDIVITGEGRMDGQTVFGKTPAGVSRVAAGLGIPVIAISGSLGAGVHGVHAIGISAYFSALQEPIEEELLPKRGPDMLTDCAEQVGRLLALPVAGRTALKPRKEGTPCSKEKRTRAT